MAIALDAATHKTEAAATVTQSHTTSGTDRLIIVALATVGSNSSDVISGVTYNSTALTRANTVAHSSEPIRNYLYYLIAPDTGANNVVVSSNASYTTLVNIATYTGVEQSGQPDSITSGQGSGTTYQLTTTTIDDNSLFVGEFINNLGGSATAGTATQFVVGNANNWGLFSSSPIPVTPAGSTTLTVTSGVTNQPLMIGASFSPSATAGAAAVITPPTLLTLGVG